MTEPAGAAPSHFPPDDVEGFKRDLGAIGSVAGHVAHDFNNILAAISGSATLLEIGAPADAPRHVQNIQLASQRGARLMRQMLALSPRSDAELTGVAVGPLLEKIAATVRTRLPSNQALTLAVQDNLPAIRADANQVEQAVTALCDNARDAMPSGGQIIVNAAVRELDGAQASRIGFGARAGKFVVIRVEDTGRGIAPDLLRRIFVPFFTTKPKGKDSGTGLGLTIVLRIMLRHDGFVSVESDSPGGAAFSCYFPA